MTKPVIRRAVAGDVAEILDLVAELDRHLLAADPALWRPPPRTAAPVEDLVENGVTAVAALPDGALAGVVAGRIEQRAEEPTCVGFISHAVVRQAWRRRGLGGRLVARVLDDFDAAGVRDVSLRYVVASREAASFWTKLGFEAHLVMANATPAVIRRRLAAPS